MADPILATRRLGKRFGTRWAVRNVDLAIHRGDIFGFLGPNGAGKSTTIRMVLSLIRPTEGEVHLFGHSLRTHRADALRRVGGIVEKPDFYLYLSAIRNLELVGALTGGVPRRRIEEVLELVGLSSRSRDLVKTYSHGMKQRLGIAQALLTDPELVVLDEPTNGLDPQGMKEVRELIRSLAHERQKTIILSSHLLSEVELVANRMAIIHQGELAVQGEVRTLLEGNGAAVHLQATPLRTAAAICRKHRAVTAVEIVNRELRVTVPTNAVPDLVAALVRGRVRVGMIRPVRSLEEYFMSIVEQSHPA
jgi:ABC-type multidrug transport system ATPase subunit